MSHFRLIHDRELQLCDGTTLLGANRYQALMQQGFSKEELGKLGFLPIHESFRVVALAEPPRLGGGQPSWLTPELLSLFLYQKNRRTIAGKLPDPHKTGRTAAKFAWRPDSYGVYQLCRSTASEASTRQSAASVCCRGCVSRWREGCGQANADPGVAPPPAANLRAHDAVRGHDQQGYRPAAYHKSPRRHRMEGLTTGASCQIGICGGSKWTASATQEHGQRSAAVS